MSYPELEQIAAEFLLVYRVKSAPVPIEIILQRPQKDMWHEVNLAQLTASFSRADMPFGPRMSLARLMVRNLLKSKWGKAHQLDQTLADEALIYCFARMIMMPLELVAMLKPIAHNAPTLSKHFAVPEADAEQRLQDLIGLI